MRYLIRQNIARWCQQTFNTKNLLTSPINVLPLHLKQSFPLMIWIFTEGEGDGIESRLAFKIFSTLWLYFLQLRKAQMLLYHLSSFKLLRWWHTNLGVCYVLRGIDAGLYLYGFYIAPLLREEHIKCVKEERRPIDNILLLLSNFVIYRRFRYRNYVCYLHIV